jgi:hypothetical protein
MIRVLIFFTGGMVQLGFPQAALVQIIIVITEIGLLVVILTEILSSMVASAI